MQASRPWRSPVYRIILLLAAGWMSVGPGALPAQVTGEEAEMDRLQVRAEELMANADSEGAAMSMGRAALMASQLARRSGDQPGAVVYRGAETLFRAQEHGYRALALFQRAGGQPPASTGVCHTLQAARSGIRKAGSTLALDEQGLSGLSPAEKKRLSSLQATVDDWTTVVVSMASDFQCPENPLPIDHPPG